MKVVDENNTSPSGTPHPSQVANNAPRPDMSQAEDIVCDECGGKIFEEKLMLKKLSKFLTGSDKDSITPIPVVACAACNHINEMFIPKL